MPGIYSARAQFSAGLRPGTTVRVPDNSIILEQRTNQGDVKGPETVSRGEMFSVALNKTNNF